MILKALASQMVTGEAKGGLQDLTRSGGLQTAEGCCPTAWKPSFLGLGIGRDHPSPRLRLGERARPSRVLILIMLLLMILIDSA
jgi:hypothetical protein